MSALSLNNRWTEIAVGTNSGATATKTALLNKALVVDHVNGFTDANSLIQLKDGSTVLAEWYIDVTAANDKSFSFSGCWVITRDAAAAGVIAASSADCAINISGFALP